MAQFYGFNPPFIGGPQNIMSRQEDQRLIKNDILQFLRTTKGERVHRLNFGTRLRTTVFDTLTPADLTLLQNEIATDLQAEEPRIVVRFVQIQQDADQHTYRVYVGAVMRDNPNQAVNVSTLISDSGA